MKWFMVRREGDERRYVPLEHLEKVWRDVHAFGAEKGDRRVGFDWRLARRGLPPMFVQDGRGPGSVFSYREVAK